MTTEIPPINQNQQTHVYNSENITCQNKLSSKCYCMAGLNMKRCEMEIEIEMCV